MKAEDVKFVTGIVLTLFGLIVLGGFVLWGLFLFFQVSPLWTLGVIAFFSLLIGLTILENS